MPAVAGRQHASDTQMQEEGLCDACPPEYHRKKPRQTTQAERALARCSPRGAWPLSIRGARWVHVLFCAYLLPSRAGLADRGAQPCG
eukprot:8105664-Pyramimonas_sp.AAC.1